MGERERESIELMKTIWEEVNRINIDIYEAHNPAPLCSITLLVFC